MSSQLSSRILWTSRAASKKTDSVLSRHAHIASSSLPLRSHGPSVSISQPSSLAPHVPCPPPASRETRFRKTRSYTTFPASPSQTNTGLSDSRQDEREETERQHDSLQYVKKYHQRPKPGEQEESGGSGIIITSDRHTLRDKQGRPWAKSSEQVPSQGTGGGVRGIGVGVTVSTPSATKKRRPRLELRDLAVKPKKKLEPWQAQKVALEKKFGDEGWKPRKKLSPDAMDGIRALHDEDPERWSTPVLAEHFKVSAEAIRRILKSRWKPKDDAGMQKRRERWTRRHDRIWDHMAELGLRPEREKDRDVEDPDTFDEDLRAKEMLNNARIA